MSDDIVHYKTTTTKGMYMYVCMYVCIYVCVCVCVCVYAHVYCEQMLQVFFFFDLLLSELDHVLGDTQCDINGKLKEIVFCPAEGLCVMATTNYSCLSLDRFKNVSFSPHRP